MGLTHRPIPATQGLTFFVYYTQQKSKTMVLHGQDADVKRTWVFGRLAEIGLFEPFSQLKGSGTNRGNKVRYLAQYYFAVAANEKLIEEPPIDIPKGSRDFFISLCKDLAGDEGPSNDAKRSRGDDRVEQIPKSTSSRLHPGEIASLVVRLKLGGDGLAVFSGTAHNSSSVAPQAPDEIGDTPLQDEVEDSNPIVVPMTPRLPPDIIDAIGNVRDEEPQIDDLRLPVHEDSIHRPRAQSIISISSSTNSDLDDFKDSQPRALLSSSPPPKPEHGQPKPYAPALIDLLSDNGVESVKEIGVTRRVDSLPERNLVGRPFVRQGKRYAEQIVLDSEAEDGFEETDDREWRGAWRRRSQAK